MKILLLFLILVVPALSPAQVFRVSSAKKCWYMDGGKINKGDTLGLQTAITVGKNGELQLSLENGAALFCTRVGPQRIDTLYESLKRTRAYILHDSVFQVLKANNLHRCNFKYTLVCEPRSGGFVTRYADDIKIDGPFRIETSDPSVKIQWKYPAPYSGKFFVLISDMFGDFLQIIPVPENSIELQLAPFRSHGAVIYRIISEECRESPEQVIVMN